MRYWLLSFAVVIGLASIGVLQPPAALAQGKDLKKDPFKKDKDKDKKDGLDPKDNPASPKFKAPDEVLGKGFAYWQKMIHSDDQSEREIAMKNIMFFGFEKAYEAVPDIIQELRDHKGNKNVDLSFRVNGIQVLSTIFKYTKEPNPKHIDEAYALYKPALEDSQVILRMQTMKALPYLGPKTKQSLGTVFKLGKDGISWEVRKEAIPVIVVLASIPDAKGKPDAKSLADAWGHMKNRADPEIERSHLVRQVALQGMSMIAHQTPGVAQVPPEIVRGLKDPSPVVKLTTLQCLANMSHRWDTKDRTDRISAVNKLKNYLDYDESDKALRMWAHAVIMTIEQKITTNHLAPIVDGLAHKDPAMRMLALQLIGMAGPDAKKFALTPVMSAINDPDVGVGAAAIHALVPLKATECKPMLETLEKQQKDKLEKDGNADPRLYYAAAEALQGFVEMEKHEKEKQDKKGEKK